MLVLLDLVTELLVMIVDTNDLDEELFHEENDRADQNSGEDLPKHGLPVL